jgi:hypothetical protein
MDLKELRNLQEAYLEVVINEGLGGAKNQDDYEERQIEMKRVRDEHLKKYKSGELPFQKQKKADQAQEFLKKHPRKKGTQQEQVDLYDLVLSHLLDEGYAETLEAAEVMMVNMSEGWRQSIVEGRDVERGEEDDNPDVKAHNKSLGYKKGKAGYAKRPNPANDPRYGSQY